MTNTFTFNGGSSKALGTEGWGLWSEDAGNKN